MGQERKRTPLRLASRRPAAAPYLCRSTRAPEETMPANLTPFYEAAEQRFRAERTLPERIAALQEMLAVFPKHEGIEHMRADLRSRSARLLDEPEAPPTGQRVGNDHVLADGEALELHE